MYLEENIELLKGEFPGIDWDRLMQFKTCEDSEDIRVENSRSGLPTLVIKQDGKEQYIHSKYDPYGEAVRIAEKFEDIDNGKNVLFYGVGLGYLIQAIVKKYSKIKISIYEPNPRIFYNFISHVSLKKFPIENLNNIFIDGIFTDEKEIKYGFLRSISLNVALVTLPSYENIFPREFEEFKKDFINSIKTAGIDMRTRYVFEKQWVFNSVKNFGTVLRTNNMIRKNKDFFRGKPAIIVSAGPSLEEELENLKHIKENGLAYIFSVGSAIKVLLANNIYPDAVCAIDTLPSNYEIYQGLIKNPDNRVPLIFGTAFYNKAVSDFSYEKLHTNLEVDTIAGFYLKYPDSEDIGMVKVAPSVALTTMQILGRMECDPIILVGQNLAFRNKQYYARDVMGYEQRPVEMDGKDKAEAFLVEDVEGGEVFTIPTLNVMRTQMELLIKLWNLSNVINTTRGGAKIQGTVYETLDSVIKSKLTAPVVTKEWLDGTVESYDKLYLSSQYELMIGEYGKVNHIIGDLSDMADDLLKINRVTKEKAINRLLNDFGKSFSKLVKNKFYNTFLYKISTVEHDILLRDLENLASKDSLLEKAKKAGEYYSDFINKCKENLEFISPLYDELNKTIVEYLEEVKD